MVCCLTLLTTMHLRHGGLFGAVQEGKSLIRAAFFLSSATAKLQHSLEPQLVKIHPVECERVKDFGGEN